MTSKKSEIEIYRRFAERAVEPETLFLLNSEDAMDFIEEIQACGILVSGVEGFQITETGAYQPRQDFSNDIGDQACGYEFFLEGTKCLIRKGAEFGIRFQVVLENAGD